MVRELARTEELARADDVLERVTGGRSGTRAGVPRGLSLRSRPATKESSRRTLRCEERTTGTARDFSMTYRFWVPVWMGGLVRGAREGLA